MSEPFVFRFELGEQGEPQVMYIADVRCACGLCGHVQMQRFYHAAPFHPLTAARLSRLAGEIHRRAGYECENCGEAVGPEHAQKAALIYGFPDDAGLIRAFVDRPGGDEPGVLFELVGRRRLDPQVLPGFEPSSGGASVYRRLDESLVERDLGRIFNPKLLWLELFDDWRADPEGGAFARAAPGYWFLLDEDRARVAELAEEVDAEDESFGDAASPGRLVWLDDAPRGLATHSYPEKMPGRYQTWLDEPVVELIEAGQAAAAAYVSPKAAVESIERTFEVAQLDYSQTEGDGDLLFCEITTPREERYGKDLSLLSVLRRAVYTGITPGEAGRLTAEEIAGLLLRLFKRS